MIFFDAWLARPWWTLDEACWLVFDVEPPLYGRVATSDPHVSDNVADFRDAAELATGEGRLQVEATGTHARVEPLAFLRWALPYRKDGMPRPLRDAVLFARVAPSESAGSDDVGDDAEPWPDEDRKANGGVKRPKDLKGHKELQVLRAALAVIAYDVNKCGTSRGKLTGARIADQILHHAPALFGGAPPTESEDLMARVISPCLKLLADPSPEPKVPGSEH